MIYGPALVLNGFQEAEHTRAQQYGLVLQPARGPGWVATDPVPPILPAVTAV